MSRQRLRKVMRSVIAHILVWAMVFSAVSPFVAQGIDMAAAEKLEQQKWQDILAMDLSGNDSARTMAASSNANENSEKPKSNNGNGNNNANAGNSKNNAATQEYVTDRFIVK